MKNSDKHNIAEIRVAKALMSSRESYLENAVGYVEVKRAGSVCDMQAKVIPEHKISNKYYIVTVHLDEANDSIGETSCDGCAAAAATPQPRPAFSVRIVVCDHYSTKPIPGVDVIYSEFRGSDIKQVPVLRIFGSAPDGHKVCLHVHGVFPYFYVPCPVSNPEPQFLYQMAASLDKALNIAMKQAMSANQHVYKISLVKGLPFYGYHDKDHLYLKVFLYNPGLIKQAVELCCNGAILGKTFQPHEAHLNFTLQFFIDFNLFGMSNIDLLNVSFRKKPGISQTSNDPLGDDDDSTLKPESICCYEVDCSASHIINRQRIGKGGGIENPGLEEVWKQEQQRRKELNMSMASKSLSQGRLKAEETDSHYKFHQMCLTKMSSQIDKPVDMGNEISPVIDISYPAESLEGSQLLKAVDVSVHLPDNSLGFTLSESLKNSETGIEDADDTLVDESVALNISLRYSQVLLDSEDLDLVNMLQHLDEKNVGVEDDSVMGTPAEGEVGMDDDDDEAEYSQIFNDNTIIEEPYKSKDDDSESSQPWNDSFWEDATIPQLDGTFDDDHVKKVRKRKMRPFKLGLSKPKTKKKITPLIKDEPVSNMDSTDSDEINVSRETVERISKMHLNKAVKVEIKSVIENVEDKIEHAQISNESITDLVNKAIAKYENVKIDISETYDLHNKYRPLAGPSTCNKITESAENCDKSFESSQDSNDLGFISFYNASKLFDASIDEKNQTINGEVQEITGVNVKIDDRVNVQNFEKCDIKLDSAEENMKLYYSENTLVSHNSSFQVKSCPTKDSCLVLTPKFRPPTTSYVTSTFQKYNIPQIKHPDPFFSNPKDVGDKVEIGQMIIKLQSHTTQDQKPLEKVLDTTSIEEWRQLIFLQNNESDTSKPEYLKALLAGNRQCILEPVQRPPTTKEAVKWIESLKEETANMEEKSKTIGNNEVTNIIDDLENSQAIGLNEIQNSISLESTEKEQTNFKESLQVTKQPDGSFLCFGSAQKESEVADSPVIEMNFLTIIVCEVHTDVRGDLCPDPSIDQIQAVFISIINDCPPDHFLQKSITEIIVVDDMTAPKKFDRCAFKNIRYVNNESELIEKVIVMIKKHDPDIMCGYEIEMNSWGYILERAQVLGLEVIMEISRITEKYRQKRSRSEEKNDFDGRIIGRVLFNVWRLFRHELALSSYSFENCMYEILKERVPKYSYAQLSEWWNDESRMLRWLPVEYYLTRLSGTVRMLEKLDIINRTAELARLFGIQWWEVLTRGSQFRVESLMLRAARALNLLALSPSVGQRAAMPAPTTLPLIYEPESRYYSSPVIVLDFQSLYPSMMIAYNYCYSTCIGNLDNVTGDAPYTFGAWKLRIPHQKLTTLISNDLVHWSPVGAGFVRAGVRRGVLPALLRRILAARQAVKKGLRGETDEAVKKAMHSRQLGLKLIANVTYGYTAANFSGRMPCVEVADSVVAKGRETLERAIKLVENGDWNVKVVYGDTDSMFVLVPGRSRADAFRIGQQIADAVTADNPSPVALKLEKVYHPCILQTKKRYVGYMYESETAEPVYEAKGIETVRRDGCPAAVKLLHRSLMELFTSGDMSAVKRLVTSSLTRLADGAMSPQELLFTREYHGAKGYKGGAAPPFEIARRLIAHDVRAAPRVGSRVAWLVTAGAPGLPLVKLARTPEELRKQPSRPHIAYYVTRVMLPPLHRCLSLLGVNVFKWWSELGYSRDAQHQAPTSGGIARYLWRERCALCGGRANRSLCDACARTPQRAVAALCTQLNVATSHVQACEQICSSCCGHQQHEHCENTECAMLWRRQTAALKLTQVQDIIRQAPPMLRANDTWDF